MTIIAHAHTHIPDALIRSALGQNTVTYLCWDFLRLTCTQRTILGNIYIYICCIVYAMRVTL